MSHLKINFSGASLASAESSSVDSSQMLRQSLASNWPVVSFGAGQSMIRVRRHKPQTSRTATMVMRNATK